MLTRVIDVVWDKKFCKKKWNLIEKELREIYQNDIEIIWHDIEDIKKKLKDGKDIDEKLKQYDVIINEDGDYGFNHLINY